MAQQPLKSPVDLESLHALEVRTLRAYRDRDDAERSDADLLGASGIGPGQLRRAVEWLLSKGLLAMCGERPTCAVSLTEAGAACAAAGATPESALVARASQDPPPTLRDLQADARFDRSEWGSAFGGLKQEGVIRADGEAIRIADEGRAAFYRDRLFPRLFARLKDAGEGASLDLAAFPEEVQDYVRANARKRGKGRSLFRIDERMERTYRLTEAGRGTLQGILQAGLSGEEVSRLTPDLLRTGGWKQAAFRRYDLTIRPPRILIGRRHAYRAYLDSVRRRLLSLGFEEMCGPLVETEFWNMDALFMPQFHAARNIHDAYYVKHPQYAEALEEPFASRVAEAHTSGGDTGSRGWRYPFDPRRARRLILRSQGTALSARTLAFGAKVPGKYFAIARCFRYDDVDATHGAEFIQVEGIVLGEDIHFRSLLGLLKLFALEIAQAEEVRFAPDYFPFTEPSVELQAKHPTLGWMELGGAGLFRPEVTRPLGVGVPVIAWGLGVDRMAMVALGIEDIRDLFSADLDFVRNER